MNSSKVNSLQFNVAQLLHEPIGGIRVCLFDGQEVTVPDGQCHGLKGEVRFLRTDKGLLGEVTAEAGLKVSCCRCLSEMESQVTVSFKEEFFPTVDILTGAPLSVPPESFAIDGRHILDLGAAIQEYVILNMPLKPLCRPGCRGICATCGKNLNLGSCQCSSARKDDRWASLESLLQNKS